MIIKMNLLIKMKIILIVMKKIYMKNQTKIIIIHKR